MKTIKNFFSKKTSENKNIKIFEKYCLYHHGSKIITHDCGTILCKECIWEYKNHCPSCGKKIEKITKEIPGVEGEPKAELQTGKKIEKQVEKQVEKRIEEESYIPRYKKLPHAKGQKTQIERLGNENWATGKKKQKSEDLERL